MGLAEQGVDPAAVAGDQLQGQGLLEGHRPAVLEVAAMPPEDQDPAAIEHDVPPRRRRQEEPRLGRLARLAVAAGLGVVGVGLPDRLEAEVARPPRVRLLGHPRLEPGERRVAVGHLDGDRRPPHGERPDLPRHLPRDRQRAADDHQGQAARGELVLHQPAEYRGHAGFSSSLVVRCCVSCRGAFSHAASHSGLRVHYFPERRNRGAGRCDRGGPSRPGPQRRRPGDAPIRASSASQADATPSSRRTRSPTEAARSE